MADGRAEDDGAGKRHFSLSAVQTLFNKFFRKGHKFFRDRLDAWMSRPREKVSGPFSG
ncbi:MAG: hypothetical protein U0744_07725 [Gemmataceae bacterium]